jgi:hypothetical protein
MLLIVLLLFAFAPSPLPPRVDLTETAAFDGGEGGLFLDVEGTAILPDGTWFAADKLSYRVFKLSPSGKVISRAGSRGNQPGEFAGPGPIDARQDQVAVADFASRRIQLLSPALMPERTFHTPGPIFDLHYDEAGTLWVASHGGQTAGMLARYDDSGQELSRIEPRGVSSDLFTSVFHFSTPGSGLLCLAYLTQNSIEVWKTDGSYVRAFSIPGLPSRSATHSLKGFGKALAVPDGNIFRSMTADSRGHIFLLGEEYSEHPLQDLYVCDTSGRFLATVVLPEKATLIRCGPDGSLFAVTGKRDIVRKYAVRFRGV